MKKSILIIILIVVVLLLLLLFFFECGKDPTPQDQSITIASWNLKNIGQSKFNDPTRIDIIIDVLKNYDIIAIQEVKDISLQLPQLLVAKMNEDGSNYNVVASDRVGRNVFEQYLFVYDDDKIDHAPSTKGYGIEPNNEFAREPFYAMFRSGNFDFYLMNIHTDPDDVAIEIPALSAAYLDLQNNTPNENDIILLGDFNGKAPGVIAGSYITMDALAQIPNIIFTINEETNTRGGKAYDNIIFQDNYTTEYSNLSGVNTFWLPYGLNEDQGFAISDHKLVWVMFNIPDTDDD
jgi:hypothetical protein